MKNGSPIVHILCLFYYLIMLNKQKVLPLSLFMGMTLASAGYGPSLSELGYTIADNPTSISTFGNNPADGKPYTIGNEYSFDAGYSSAGIGQIMKWKPIYAQKYDAAKGRGFIFNYDSIFFNPKVVKEVDITLESSWSAEYSYSLEKSQSSSLTNQFATAFQLSGFAKVSGSQTTAYQNTTTVNYSYSFGRTQTFKRTYHFVPGEVPDGYVCTPCLVASATLIRYQYTLYDHWWWGDYPVQTPELVNQTQTILVFDKTSTFLTLGIKLSGLSGGPTHYLL